MIKIRNIFGSKKPICYRFFGVPLRRQLIFCAGIAAMQFMQSPAVAEDNTNGLTLAEAIRRTFNNHPDLQTFHYRLDAQEGRITQAGLSPKPEVELAIEDALGTGDVSGFKSAQTTLSVSWVLDRSIKAKRTAVAWEGKRLIDSERKIKQLDSATQTARYFLTALSYQESTVIANRAIMLAETTIKEITNRVKIGKSPFAELLRAEADLAKRKLVLLNLKHELASSLHQLAAQWGSSAPTFSSLSGALTNQPGIIAFQDLKAQIRDNPGLAKYLSLERVKEAELKLALEERNPQWKFSTGIRRYERSNDFGVVARVSIPFGGSNRNQGRIAEARAKMSQNQAEADALRIRMETSLYVVYQKLLRNIHLSDMLKKDVIPRLEQALTETRKAYDLGKYSYLEWMAVQNDLLDAQSTLLAASLEAHLNKIELERLTGAKITSPF